MVKCKHELKNRMAVASPSHWGNQLASVVCLKCGDVLYTTMIDPNNLDIDKKKVEKRDWNKKE